MNAPRPERGWGRWGQEVGALARLALVVTVAVVVLMRSGDLGAYLIWLGLAAWFIHEAMQ